MLAGSGALMAALLLDIARWYGISGLAVAAVFLTVGIGRVMASARGAFVFRILLVPGVVLLWPAVLLRWLQLERGAAGGLATHRPPLRAQRICALVLAAVVPLVLAVAVLVRQDGPREAAAVQIDPPATDGAER